jgi:purine-nucleoside phosphorylase
MTDESQFFEQVRHYRPQSAVILGSGLSLAVSEVRTLATLPYSQISNFASTSVKGHRGQLVLGFWKISPVLVCFGRVHFYEGHSWDRVTKLVDLLADLGVERLTLTNAAGGLRSDLNPGDLMAIRGHLELLDRESWKSPLIETKHYHRIAANLPVGVYAGLTGPCYETPAEIRALAKMGVDAVGMSTVMEARRAAERGLSVAAVSCITNKAAGLSDSVLSHHDVEATAKLAVVRLQEVLESLL